MVLGKGELQGTEGINKVIGSKSRGTGGQKDFVRSVRFA